MRRWFEPPVVFYECMGRGFSSWPEDTPKFAGWLIVHLYILTNGREARNHSTGPSPKGLLRQEIIIIIIIIIDCLIGLEVSVLKTNYEVAGSIPETSKILNVNWIWNGVHPASWG